MNEEPDRYVPLKTSDALRAIRWNVTCSFNVRQSISRWRQVRGRVAPHVVSRFPVFKLYFSYRKEPVHLSHKVSSPEVRRMPLFWRIQPKRRTIWYVNKTQLKLACKSQNSRSKNVSLRYIKIIVSEISIWGKPQTGVNFSYKQVPQSV